jgi:carbon monoxide dehydrogenase subunit G
MKVCPPSVTLAVAALLLAEWSLPCPAAADLTVHTSRRGSAVEVDARATVHAPLALIWQTLTDYDRLSEFVPGISRSRLLDYRGTAAIVEQSGEAGFLFFHMPINVVVESLERAPDVIEVRVLKGNLKQLQGRYRIEADPAGSAQTYLLRWTGVIEPERPLPPLVGEWLLRSSLTDQFRGMVNEIERRARDAGTRK